jgi:phosphatidate cytidylyltransferase
MAPQEANVSRPTSTLAVRITSAVFLAPPVLAAIYFGSPAFEILIAVAAAILVWEWGHLWSPAMAKVSNIALGGFVLLACGLAAAGLIVSALAVLVLAAAGMFWIADRHGAAYFAILYLGLPCVALVWLRNDPGFGFEIVLWVFAIVWSSDIGAFAAGKTIGGPKLIPKISPNKTWAGLFGGLTAAAIVGTAVASFLAPTKQMLWVVLSSLLIGAVTQAGDLLESWIKRRVGVKDSGALIPGHGGLMDRIDGLMVAAVVTALMMALSRSSILPWS